MDFSGSKILVVDDEEDLRGMISSSLKKKGAEVFLAGSVKLALEMLKTIEVHLIISDLKMPGESGIELASRVKDMKSDCPAVILMTGYADVHLDKLYHVGIEALLAKPFTSRCLLETAARLLVENEQRWQLLPVQSDSEKNILGSFKSIKDAEQNRLLALGRGGIFIARPSLDVSENENVFFDLSFEDPNFSQLTGYGIVRWVRKQASDEIPSGIGIEFLGIKESSRIQVIKIVNTINRKSFIPQY